MDGVDLLLQKNLYCGSGVVVCGGGGDGGGSSGGGGLGGDGGDSNGFGTVEVLITDNWW